MREHEVPTHVQAEDKVLLWFTFPQIVAVVAVCALAYGAYRYFPLGPAEFRLGIAILLGVLGIALTVGKVGGRGLLLVAADLLKFNLGARRYAGSPNQLVLTEPPIPAEARPDPLRLLAKKAASGVGKAAKAARKKGRPPFRPHSWFGKRRRPKAGEPGSGHQPQEAMHRKPWNRLLAVAALGVLAVVLLPTTALADDPDDEDPGWRLDEIYFVPPEPVPGRRIFIERLAVSGDTAAVTPAGRPRPGPEGPGLRRTEGRDPDDGVQHQPDGGSEQELQPDPERPRPVLHLFVERQPGKVRGGVAEEPPDPLPVAPGRRRALRPGGHLPGMDAGADHRRPSPRSASRTPARRLRCRSTAATSARRSPPCWTPPSPASPEGSTSLPEATAPRLRLSPMVNPASPCPSPTKRRSTSWKSRRTWRPP